MKSFEIFDVLTSVWDSHGLRTDGVYKDAVHDSWLIYCRCGYTFSVASQPEINERWSVHLSWTQDMLLLFHSLVSLPWASAAEFKTAVAEVLS